MESKIFASGLSRNKNWPEALKEISGPIKRSLGGKSCDLLVFFLSESYSNLDPKVFSEALAQELPCRVMLGCNSGGVIGDEREIEMEPALSMLAMHLPDVRLYPFSMTAEEAQGLEKGSDLINFFDIYPTDKPHFLCLADPASCDITRLLHAFNEGYKGLPVIGGLASGGVMGMPNWLCLNGNIHPEGVAGVALVGRIEFETIVSQGCRPIGKPFVITKAENNVLYELAGRPALAVVRELLEGLSSKDRKLAEQSLSVGLVMNEQQSSFKRGDFLIRNLMGFDPETDALAIGAHLKVGQTLQFQVRDAETSEEDLKLLLGKMSPHPAAEPQGALLFSCCGRGRGLYGKADHDATAIQKAKGPLPMTGFFANGEIGPIGNKNYVHGYTSSLVIFK